MKHKTTFDGNRVYGHNILKTLEFLKLSEGSCGAVWSSVTTGAMWQHTVTLCCTLWETVGEFGRAAETEAGCPASTSNKLSRNRKKLFPRSHLLFLPGTKSHLPQDIGCLYALLISFGKDTSRQIG